MVIVNLMMDAVADDPAETLRRDPEVRQARAIAEAARSELLECVSGQHGPVDLARAGRMLAALRTATALAEDAEDRVLVHNGLLMLAEADRRAADRAALSRRDGTGAAAGARPHRAAQARVQAAMVRAALPYLFSDPRRRAAVTGLVAVTVAGVSAAVVIARGRGVRAA